MKSKEWTILLLKYSGGSKTLENVRPSDKKDKRNAF
jgi:hypothetical protein